MVSVEETIKKCRINGMRITAQRIEILRHLEGNRTHPTAEEVFRNVKRKHPTISRATVYNTINMLVELGQIRELVNVSGSRRFDPDLSPHDHAVCLKCGGFFDVESNKEKNKSVQVMGKPFEVRFRDTTYHGICQACKDSNDS